MSHVPAPVTSPGRHNVLLVCVDQWRGDALSIATQGERATTQKDVV